MTPKHLKLTKGRINKIVKLYESGMSQENVGLEVNLSKDVIRATLRKYAPNAIRKCSRKSEPKKEPHSKNYKTPEKIHADLKARYEKFGMRCPPQSQLMAGK